MGVIFFCLKEKCYLINSIFGIKNCWRAQCLYILSFYNQGNNYKTELSINVIDAASFSSLLTNKWNNLVYALAQGDINRYLTYFTFNDKDRYSIILSNVSSQLPQIFSSIQGFQVYSLSNDTAEAAALRIENGILFSYPVVFGLDIDGIWKLKGF